LSHAERYPRALFRRALYSLPTTKKEQVKSQNAKVKSENPAATTVFPGGFAIRQVEQVKSKNLATASALSFSFSIHDEGQVKSQNAKVRAKGNPMRDLRL
jgi:hypothetical protein